MPSRLSSLLVRDGLVGVKRMEKAFQRQVIYGGSLDTILLEMNLVPEERLVQYLALASGLPPAARDEGTAISPTAVALVPREVAEQHRACPVALGEGDALRVLVCSPLEIADLEDLADLLDRPLQPLITPEYRWHLAFASAYALDPPARFTTLARALDVDPTTPPVGRARSVIVDALATPPPVDLPTVPSGPPRFEPEPADSTRATDAVPAIVDAAATLRVSALERDDAGRLKGGTLLGVQPVRAVTEPGAIQPTRTPSVPRPPTTTPVEAAPAEPAALAPTAPVIRSSIPSIAGPVVARTTSPSFARPRTFSPGIPSIARTRSPNNEDAVVVDTPLEPPSRPSDSAPTWLAPRSEAPARPAAIKIPAPRAATAPMATAGRDSPLPIARARELLAIAEDRDTIFLTLLRAARSRARWAGLLTVQGGAAIGRVALAEPDIDTAQVTSLLIPLDAVSPFRTAVAGHQPHIGPLTSGDAGIDAMLVRLGGTVPPSALVLPIVLRDRTIALVVAHRAHSDIRIVDVTELLPLATVASDALGRLIVSHKAAGYRAPTASAAPAAPIEVADVDTKRIPTGRRSLSEGEAWTVPADRPSMPVIEVATETIEPVVAVRAIDAVLDTIEAAREGGADDAIDEAVERASETLGALVRRFPGALRVDRFATTGVGRTLRAAQYGGLLELCVRLGSVASELLIEKMSSAQRDVRFYATICAAELRPRNAVFALVERLFDQDFGVRVTAIEALAGYPIQDLGQALVRVRRAIHSTDSEVVAAATAAVIALGDIDAVGDLIGSVERGDRGGEHARRALVTLAAQDFGASERKWRKWFEGARRRHRIEWLIDGLSHKEDAIREGAINDLRRLTGEYFGYHHDLPRKERDAAAARWAAWWKDAGARRFATK